MHKMEHLPDQLESHVGTLDPQGSRRKGAFLNFILASANWIYLAEWVACLIIG